MYNLRLDCINPNCNCQFQSVLHDHCNYLQNSIAIEIEAFNIQSDYDPNNQYDKNSFVGPQLFPLIHNILQSNKLALLNLNHKRLVIQFIAKYKLKQCHGHIETKD